MDDDPCWGGPEPSKHDLPFLLQQIIKSDIVIHECSSYIAINKPPDLRMDGPYSSTVHKLVSYWYPSRSLLQQEDQQLQLRSDDDDKCKEEEILLKLISSISKFNDVHDNELRPCHQLDYATSGMLLLARSRDAAHKACTAFESRNMQKEYLAVVSGDIDINSVPLMTNGNNFNIDAYLKEMEDRYKQNKKNKKQSFIGYLPPHAIFEKWKSWKKREQNRKKNDEDDDAVFMDFMQLLSKSEEDELLQLKWSAVNSNGTQDSNYEFYRQSFIDIGIQWNQLKKSRLLQQAQESQQQEYKNVPYIFRLNLSDDFFYINASIATIPDSFPMMIHPTIMQNIPNARYYQHKLWTNHNDDTAQLNLDYKPAMTLCKCLSKGTTRHGENVTKVLLRPLTGRRHQLRLHMVVCGNAIVGDTTYEYNVLKEEGRAINRMCLHAFKLTFLEGEKQSFVAPDPFIIEKSENGDNILVI